MDTGTFKHILLLYDILTLKEAGTKILTESALQKLAIKAL